MKRTLSFLAVALLLIAAIAFTTGNVSASSTGLFQTNGISWCKEC
jgi:hypothetical protein